jgi:MraZ protein
VSDTFDLGSLNTMKYFIANYENKVDKKGRVSVPASFRSVLEKEAEPGVVLFPNQTDWPCVNGAGISRIETFIEQLEHMNPTEEDRNYFSMAMIGMARQLPIDADGRIILPADILEATGITEKAVFVGLGQTFQVWSPEAFQEYSAKAQSFAQANNKGFNWNSKPSIKSSENLS